MSLLQSSPSPIPAPKDFLRIAWRLAQRDPMIFLARFCAEAFAMVLRFGIIFGIGALVVIHFGNHVARGGAVTQWIPLGVERFTSPSVLAAIAGLLLASWAISFTAACVAASGIFGVLSDGVSGRPIARWRSALRAMPRHFPKAVAIRALTSCVNVTILTMGVGAFLVTGQLAGAVQGATAAGPVLSAAIWAFAGALYFLSAGLVRLTTEMVAAPFFLRRKGLGEAIIEAAALVTSRPVLAYRIFVQAAVVLLPPLLLYWVALFGQQLAIGTPGLSMVGDLVVLIADVMLLAGLAAFAVMLQASFFAYYAWDAGLLAISWGDAHKKKRAPTLDELLPQDWPNVFDIEDVVGPWAPEHVEPPSGDDVLPPAPGPFDLGAILNTPEAGEKPEN